MNGVTDVPLAPTTDGLTEEASIVIFGASGDLTARKLLPALFHLWRDGFLSSRAPIIGAARRPKSDAEFREEIFAHVQSLDTAYFDRNPVGRLVTRMTSDVDVINEMFAAGAMTILMDVFTLLGIVSILFAIDWHLALVSLSLLPLMLLAMNFFRVRARESYRRIRVRIARINAYLQERITGMATVQLFRREARDFAAFDDIDRKHRDANVESIFYYSVFYPAIEFVSAIAASLIIWVGGGWAAEGTLTLGSLVAFLQYSQRFFRPISDMSEKFNILQSAMASSERIFRLLDEPVVIASPQTPVALPPTSRGGHISLDRVWFAYNEPKGADPDWVLKDVSFEVRPGERIGIVGATGSGKTTIINLLLRFYDVQRGAVRIDGVDVRNRALEDLRGMFSLVLQDVHLFTGTIAENIRLGNRAITDEQIRRAAKAVHADSFIDRLPRGYESAVAERGATLSVGQKQLLSFARALAFDPKILILDEATSSVDTETELLIRDALTALMAGRTTIAIAHRLSTIQDMDKILVLHKGVLREAGTHQELLAARGIYYKLFELQYARAG